MVGTVFPDNVIYHLRPTVISKIDIKVRHAHALRIEETLKQQVVPYGVYAGYADAVGGEAACTGTAPRPYRYAYLLCVAHKVMDYQVVVHIAHFFNCGKLIFEPVAYKLRWVAAVAPVEPFIAFLAEIFDIVLPIWRIEPRQFCFAELKLNVAALRNFHRIVGSFRDFREQ